jgi:exonuclease VII small subunit
MDFNRMQKLAGLDSKKVRSLNESQKAVKECGEMDDMSYQHLEVQPGPALDASPSVNSVSESQSPEGELVLEMEMASQNLELAIESIANAATLCPTCTQEVAAAAPLMEAMVAQASALQETLDAVGVVVLESTELNFTGDVSELPGEEAFAIGLQAGQEGLA